MKKKLLGQGHTNSQLHHEKQHLNTLRTSGTSISHETNIERFGPKHKQYNWRQVKKTFNEKSSILTVKHGGGSLMFWLCWEFGQNC